MLIMYLVSTLFQELDFLLTECRHGDRLDAVRGIQTTPAEVGIK